MRGVVFLVTLVTIGVLQNGECASKPLICYWEAWARGRDGAMSYGMDKIPTDHCTHIIYSFAGLDQATWKITSLEPAFDINQNGYKNFVGLRSKNPDLKVSIAIGGWNEGATKYSAMVSTKERRATFIASVVEWMKTYDFDGIDIDWEYPGAAERGGQPQDKQNFVLLLQELNTALKSMGGKQRLLTAAVGVGLGKAEAGYDIAAMARNVDFIHMMTYDMHTLWDGRTDHQAPLFRRKADTDDYNVADCMKLWTDRGAPSSKLIMGIPFYGRTFTLADSSMNGLKQRSTGGGTAGPYTKEQGYLAYFELCSKIPEWKRGYDAEGFVPFMSSGNQWIGYDDEDSITKKTEYIRQQGFGGALVWAVDLDDYTGQCGRGKNPLLRALRKGLDGNSPDPKPEPRPAPTTRRPDPVTTSQGSPTTANPLPDCSNKADGTMFRIPPDCSVFYTCANNAAHKNTCSGDLIFDPSFNVCNFRNAENSFGCK